MQNFKKIGLVVLGLLLLVGVYMYQDTITGWFNKQKKELTKDSPHSASQNATTTGSIDLSSGSENNCDNPVSSPIVENGKMMGVVEVGASGFNAFAIRIDKANNYEVKYKEFGESLAYEGFATYDDVKNGLRKYLTKIFDKGVSGSNVHFVISSGALKNPKTKLISDGIKKLGYVVNEVTASQEGKYALLAALPVNYYNNSFVVDMGSGNTKISYIQNNKIQSFETYGAKYAQNNVEDSKVSAEVVSYTQKVPTQYRTNMFIIGGVPYKLAKEVCDENRYTLLKVPSDYQLSDDAKWNAGINIYKSIYSVTNSEKVIFDYDANFTIGFLISLNK